MKKPPIKRWEGNETKVLSRGTAKGNAPKAITKSGGASALSEFARRLAQPRATFGGKVG